MLEQQISIHGSIGPLSHIPSEQLSFCLDLRSICIVFFERCIPNIGFLFASVYPTQHSYLFTPRSPKFLKQLFIRKTTFSICAGSHLNNIPVEKRMSELNFKCGNPGAVRFGNFINYYQFHPPDSRIAMLPREIWSSVLKHTEKCCILDIGCNTGDLTMAVYNFMKKTVNIPNCSILGIDIDPTLIKRAQENNSEEKITFKSFNIMADDIEKNPVLEFLKLEKRSRFDLIFCFSISMWIHLNYGDDGLKQFLTKVSNLTNFLLIEPQPWKCYKTAVKRLKLSNSEFPKFKDLKIRHNVEEEIESFISNHCGLIKVKESDRTEWGRKLLFFKRIRSSES